MRQAALILVVGALVVFGVAEAILGGVGAVSAVTEAHWIGAACTMLRAAIALMLAVAVVAAERDRSGRAPVWLLGRRVLLDETTRGS